MRQVTRRRHTYLYIGGYLLYSKATDLNVTHKFSSAATHTLVSDHQPGYVESAQLGKQCLLWDSSILHLLGGLVIKSPVLSISEMNSVSCLSVSLSPFPAFLKPAQLDRSFEDFLCSALHISALLCTALPLVCLFLLFFVLPVSVIGALTA